LQTGKLMQYIPQNNIYVYFRYDQKNTILIAYNADEKSVTVATDRFSERTATFTKAVNVMTGEQLNTIANLSLPAKSVTIFELK